jgi:hypothetical protein
MPHILPADPLGVPSRPALLATKLYTPPALPNLVARPRTGPSRGASARSSVRGIGLFIVVLGILYLLPVAAIYVHPRVRRVEDEPPDAVAVQA